MRNIDEQTITPAVLAAMAECGDKRLLEVTSSLVRHLHDFAREVSLTEDEWFAGIRFLTEAGRSPTIAARSSSSCRTSSACPCS